MLMTKEESLGRMVAAARQLAGLNHERLAELSGVSSSTISNIERGSNAKMETLNKIISALTNKVYP